MESSSSSDVFVDAFEYFPVVMESSSEVFQDAFEYLPEGMDSSSAQQSTSAAVLSQECLQTPGQEPTPATDVLEAETQTPGEEPTPATDVLETEPMFDYAQPSTSAAVLSERKPSSSPTDAHAQNNPTGKRTKWMKARSHLQKAGKALKCGFRTFKSKVRLCVPDQEPSQERPQTPGQEPTPATDVLEAETQTPGEELTPATDVLETETQTPGQDLTPATDVLEAETQTPGEELTPATDVLETEPMFDYAQPSTSAAVLSERKPSSSPTDAHAQNNPTEKHTKWMKARSHVRTAGKALKCGFQTFISKVRPSQERPQTPGQEPTPAESTDLTLMFPDEPTLQDKYFRSLYKVGKKLGYDDDVHKGIRRSDGQKVAIKFVERCRYWETVHMEEYKHVGGALLKLQKPPTCDHIIRLYDRFIMEQQYVLIMERLPAYVTLSEFIRRKRGCLTEETMKRIMWQTFVASRHTMIHDFFCQVNEESILINPKTLQIKLVDFDEVHFARSERYRAELRTVICFPAPLLNYLINQMRHPSGKKKHLSRECRQLRRQIHQNAEQCEGWQPYSLENILDHPWFADIPRE